MLDAEPRERCTGHSFGEGREAHTTSASERNEVAQKRPRRSGAESGHVQIVGRWLYGRLRDALLEKRPTLYR